jgi:hypothetical protein
MIRPSIRTHSARVLDSRDRSPFHHNLSNQTGPLADASSKLAGHPDVSTKEFGY